MQEFGTQYLGGKEGKPDEYTDIKGQKGQGHSWYYIIGNSWRTQICLLVNGFLNLFNNGLKIVLDKIV